jgi:hypothetical protein
VRSGNEWNSVRYKSDQILCLGENVFHKGSWTQVGVSDLFRVRRDEWTAWIKDFKKQCYSSNNSAKLNPTSFNTDELASSVCLHKCSVFVHNCGVKETIRKLSFVRRTMHCQYISRYFNWFTRIVRLLFILMIRYTVYASWRILTDDLSSLFYLLDLVS